MSTVPHKTSSLGWWDRLTTPSSSHNTYRAHTLVQDDLPRPNSKSHARGAKTVGSRFASAMGFGKKQPTLDIQSPPPPTRPVHPKSHYPESLLHEDTDPFRASLSLAPPPPVLTGRPRSSGDGKPREEWASLTPRPSTAHSHSTKKGGTRAHRAASDASEFVSAGRTPKAADNYPFRPQVWAVQESDNGRRRSGSLTLFPAVPRQEDLIDLADSLTANKKKRPRTPKALPLPSFTPPPPKAIEAESDADSALEFFSATPIRETASPLKVVPRSRSGSRSPADLPSIEYPSPPPSFSDMTSPYPSGVPSSVYLPISPNVPNTPAVISMFPSPPSHSASSSTHSFRSTITDAEDSSSIATHTSPGAISPMTFAPRDNVPFFRDRKTSLDPSLSRQSPSDSPVRKERPLSPPTRSGSNSPKPHAKSPLSPRGKQSILPQLDIGEVLSQKLGMTPRRNVSSTSTLKDVDPQSSEGSRPTLKKSASQRFHEPTNSMDGLSPPKQLRPQRSFQNMPPLPPLPGLRHASSFHPEHNVPDRTTVETPTPPRPHSSPKRRFFSRMDSRTDEEIRALAAMEREREREREKFERERRLDAERDREASFWDDTPNSPSSVHVEIVQHIIPPADLEKAIDAARKSSVSSVGSPYHEIKPRLPPALNPSDSPIPSPPAMTNPLRPPTRDRTVSNVLTKPPLRTTSLLSKASSAPAQIRRPSTSHTTSPMMSPMSPISLPPPPRSRHPSLQSSASQPHPYSARAAPALSPPPPPRPVPRVRPRLGSAQRGPPPVTAPVNRQRSILKKPSFLHIGDDDDSATIMTTIPPADPDDSFLDMGMGTKATTVTA